MMFVSLIVACWLMGRLSQHRVAFTQQINSDWKKLEAKQEAAILDLEDKRASLIQENISDMKAMEQHVRDHIEDDEKFDEAFMKGINAHFDKIESFTSKVKP